jgi:hypothetical protein
MFARTTAALAALLCLTLGGASQASIPDWSDVAVDRGAFDYTLTQWTEDWTRGASHGTYYWYEYAVTYNGTSLLTGRGVPADRTYVDEVVVYDYRDHSHQNLTASWSAVETPDAGEVSWQKGYTPDAMLAAYWQSPSGTEDDLTRYMLHTGFGGTYTMRLDRALEDPTKLALHAKGWTDDGCYEGEWVRNAPEPASLVLLGAAGGAGAVLRRRRRRSG